MHWTERFYLAGLYYELCYLAPLLRMRDWDCVPVFMSEPAPPQYTQRKYWWNHLWGYPEDTSRPGCDIVLN